MKQLLILTLLSCAFLNCKAQTSIIGITDRNVPDNINGIYFKDTNNDLNKYIGTWKYEEGNTLLIITLLKKEYIFNGYWYSDKLLGEYQYKVNGIEIVDYLPRLTDPSVNDGQHTIDGNRIVYPAYRPACDDCSLMETRVILDFADLDRKYVGSEIVVQHINDNGIEKIKVYLYGGNNAYVEPYENAPTESRVPYGTYILTKIN